jgi:hypothetical protein
MTVQGPSNVRRIWHCNCCMCYVLLKRIDKMSANAVANIVLCWCLYTHSRANLQLLRLSTNLFPKAKITVTNAFVLALLEPNFFSENVTAIKREFTGMSYIFCNYETIFLQNFHHFQHTLASFEQDAVYQCCKILCFDSGAHHRT